MTDLKSKRRRNERVTKLFAVLPNGTNQKEARPPWAGPLVYPEGDLNRVI